MSKIETAIENYKKEKKVMTDKINKYKSELAEQKKLLEQADDMEAHVIGDKIGYLNKEIRHETRMLESCENAFKDVLGNIENITKIMKDYK